MAAGIVHRDRDGLFSPGDIQRAKLVQAFEDAGISIDRLERAVADRQTNFDSIDPEIRPTVPIDFESVGSVELKGVAGPLALHRAVRRISPGESPPLMDG